MNEAAWIRAVLEAVALAIILGYLARLGSKVDSVGEKINAAFLALKDCVKWEELVRELGPVKEDLKGHESRLTKMEAKCEEHHK